MQAFIYLATSIMCSSLVYAIHTSDKMIRQQRDQGKIIHAADNQIIRLSIFNVSNTSNFVKLEVAAAVCAFHVQQGCQHITQRTQCQLLVQQ